MIRPAWNDSGKVYGYRKLQDDLLDHGETCCPNRVARLTRLAGIRAQVGYKRRPGSFGGKPSLAVDNTLDRQFDVAAPCETPKKLTIASNFVILRRTLSISSKQCPMLRLIEHLL